MYISLQDNHDFTPDFLDFLKKRMLVLGMSFIQEKRQKLLAVDNYLKQAVFTDGRYVGAQQLIIFGLKNLVIKKASSKVIISINEVIKTPFNNQLLLVDACKLIDQGNTELTPFPVFTYVFEWTVDHIFQIYSEYSFGVRL